MRRGDAWRVALRTASWATRYSTASTLARQPSRRLDRRSRRCRFRCRATIARQLAQRRLETEVIEHRRMHGVREATHFLENRLRRFARGVQPRRQLRDPPRPSRRRARRPTAAAATPRCAARSESCSSRAIAARSRSPAAITSAASARIRARSDSRPSSRMLNIEPTRSTSLSATLDRSTRAPKSPCQTREATASRSRTGRSATNTSARCTRDDGGEITDDDTVQRAARHEPRAE